MKAKIKEVRTYEVMIGDKTFSNFEVKGEMAGMIYLQSKDGSVVLDCEGINKFSSLLKGEFQTKEYPELKIIKASPNIMAIAALEANNESS